MTEKIKFKVLWDKDASVEFGVEAPDIDTAEKLAEKRIGLGYFKFVSDINEADGTLLLHEDDDDKFELTVDTYSYYQRDREQLKTFIATARVKAFAKTTRPVRAYSVDDVVHIPMSDLESYLNWPFTNDERIIRGKDIKIINVLPYRTLSRENSYDVLCSFPVTLKFEIWAKTKEDAEALFWQFYRKNSLRVHPELKYGDLMECSYYHGVWPETLNLLNIELAEEDKK